VSPVMLNISEIPGSNMNPEISIGISVILRSSPRQMMDKDKGKSIPVAGSGGQYGCEMSRLPHFRDSQLTDGSEVVSLTRLPSFTTRKIPVTHFC
jgi:hypothetical protein